jgi:hypothetical protein
MFGSFLPLVTLINLNKFLLLAFGTQQLLVLLDYFLPFSTSFLCANMSISFVHLFTIVNLFFKMHMPDSLLNAFIYMVEGLNLPIKNVPFSSHTFISSASRYLELQPKIEERKSWSNFRHM